MNEKRHAIRGIHHITAIASSAAENLRFYTEVLGLRLVKKTVNFDDPHTYHLYFGDETGTPGTIMTFFPWENMPRGDTGAGMVSAVAFTIPKTAVSFWTERLTENGYTVKTERRFDEGVICFSDPHGLSLELVAAERAPDRTPWTKGGVDEAFAIRGFHSATALVNDATEPARALTDLLGMRRIGKEDARIRFSMADPYAPGVVYDILEDRSAPPARLGGGTVHHIAFRAADDADQKRWRAKVDAFGYDATPVIDRNYFRSVYFREAGGVLFEIATDPPGFVVDETEAHLGTGLMLPPRYENRRAEIERRLPPLNTGASFRHLYVAPEEAGPGKTVVALHGTGGDERDLLSLARRVGGRRAGVLSPRGKVVENGMHRFFRRHAEGVFDTADVRRRAMELADFLVDSARRYGIDPTGLAAMGYSNGANIAAAVLLLRPEVFSEAVLFRPMMPLETDTPPDLSGRRILVLRGRFDDVIPAESTDRLVQTLTRAGAQVTEMTIEADHRLTEADIAEAENWWNRCTMERCAVAG
jgi:predicted esterase/catechol 2,3-dioxygenase-like lactoylglutathione lyase family enzyme